jgi:hypothetical protein
MAINMRVLLGLVGGLALMLLYNGPLGLLGGIREMLSYPLFPVLFGVISLFGLIAVLICSFYLIVDAFRAINRK